MLGMLAASAVAGTVKSTPKLQLKAIAFDAFVLFNPAAVVDAAVRLVGNDARAFVEAASARIFAYSWYYTSAGRYAPFPDLAADAFRFTANASQLKLTDGDIEALVRAYSSLGIWPDVPAALETLRRHRLKLALLSNLSDAMLRANLSTNRIGTYFTRVLSTDQVRQFKPAPEAYALGPEALQLSRSEIGFAASASWDASGARWFGFPTAWINRNHAAPDPAYSHPDLVRDGMAGVLELAGITA
jgi:2-haloacid dehalogenase